MLSAQLLLRIAPPRQVDVGGGALERMQHAHRVAAALQNRRVDGVHHRPPQQRRAPQFVQARPGVASLAAAAAAAVVNRQQLRDAPRLRHVDLPRLQLIRQLHVHVEHQRRPTQLHAVLRVRMLRVPRSRCVRLQRLERDDGRARVRPRAIGVPLQRNARVPQLQQPSVPLLLDAARALRFGKRGARERCLRAGDRPHGFASVGRSSSGTAAAPRQHARRACSKQAPRLRQ
mmetsp:Transcript_11749/g.34729  ORF Transcript_11749/g.34729 Transcript_11749/m.34729 type:complete len:231 (-) Transcript_11749:231-923(-)